MCCAQCDRWEVSGQGAQTCSTHTPLVPHSPPSQLWDDAWAGLDAAPVGVPGAQVQDLAYLLGSGRWRLDSDPRVIVLRECLGGVVVVGVGGVQPAAAAASAWQAA